MIKPTFNKSRKGTGMARELKIGRILFIALTIITILGCSKQEKQLEEKPWKFPVPPETIIRTVKSVIEDKAPITWVVHDDQTHEWLFANGNVTDENVRYVKLSEIVKLHPEIIKIADLPLGYSAHRDSNKHEWVRRSLYPP